MDAEAREFRGAWRAMLLLALAALSVAPFLVAREGPFLFDDNFLVLGDPRVRDLALWRRWFTEDFWNVPYTLAQLGTRLHYWRPLATASFAFDHARAAGAAGTTVFHDTNFALHAAVSLLTFALLRRLAFAPFAAAAGALVAAWHPARVESVAWIVGRTDILCAIGVLLVLVADGLRSRAAVVGVGLVGALVAFGSKETAVTLPAIVLGARLVADARLEMGAPAREGAGLQASLRRHAPVIAGLALMSVAYLAARHVWMPMSSVRRAGVRVDRLVTPVLESLGRYVELTIAPYDLAIQRAGIRRDAHGLVPSWPFVAVGAAVLAVGVWSFTRSRKSTRTAFLGVALLYVAPLVACLNIVPIGMPTLVAPRFLYLPLVAFAVVVAWLAEWAAASARGSIVAAFALAFGMASLGRASDFRSVDSFWDAEARSAPNDEAVHLARFARFMRERRHAMALAEAKQAVLDSVARGESNVFREASLESVLRAASKLLPDAAVDDMAALRRCVGALERGESPGRLALPSIRLVVEFDKAGPNPLATVKPRLATIATDLAIRVGDEDEAHARLRAVLARPAEYLDVLGPFVSFAAKLGDARAMDGFAAVAVEPMRSEWRALAEVVRDDDRYAASGGLPHVRVLARRELHGRALAAFEALDPNVREGALVEYAALLVRAGYVARGRAVLEAQGHADAQAIVERWVSETDWGRGDGPP
jgi:hypothetical protein